MSSLKNILIDCINVSKQFGYFFALKKISFKVRENTIFGIAGANGAGKTTLIKITSGLLKATMGEIVIGGLNFDDHFNNIKQKIGITTDESFLYEELTIFENLKYYANLHLNFDNENIKSKIEHYCEMFNLLDWVNEPVRILSHGMKQKVELIRVMIHEPTILFLDEPFSGLDFSSTTMVIKFLKELKNEKNLTIILTTHNINVFQQICDQLIILKKGTINKTVTKEEINKVDIKSYY
ncbi:MAG: ABC transporter ATP-binding protein [Candidatus Thorarchaeota archaeon]